jgi:hypothetical protein
MAVDLAVLYSARAWDPPNPAGFHAVSNDRASDRLSWPMVAAIGLTAESEDRCLDAVVQAKFGEAAADMGLDCLIADYQVAGDLPVAVRNCRVGRTC